MISIHAAKKFLYKKQQTQGWGSLIFITPCLFVIFILIYNTNLTVLNSIAFGLLSTIVIDALLKLFTLDIIIEKDLS